MPPKLRLQCEADPYYKRCARKEALHDHECQPDPMTRKLIEWEHALIYAGRQIQERWAIIPICWWVHRGPGLVKEINEWIAINRMSDEDVAKYYKFNWQQRKQYLNAKYGTYKEPKPRRNNR